MSLATTLKLGRVSNLPTVWTNGLTGLVLGGGALLDPRTLPLLVALSLFYVGGMYLNDAFDADIDREERPDRPIPSGLIDQRTVLNAGIVMFIVGLCLLLWIGFVAEDGTGGWPSVAGLVLITAIVVYDWHHKGNPFGPYVMGVCRMMVYVTAGLCFLVPPPALLLLAALLLFSYLIGLTAIARQETLREIDGFWPLLLFAPPLIYGALAIGSNLTAALAFVLLLVVIGIAIWMLRRRLPGDIGVAVSVLIAGICLLDAIFLASAGEIVLAWWAIAAFALTLMLQRFIPGT
ncbi:MAG: UbiA family prenyltransferase [Alphaproteobacteria bacterium]|nr:UbiA family prenyltransferase [Alphaproteobacteria bacterium]